MVLKKSIVFTLSGAFAPSLLSYCTTVRTAAGHNFYIFITFIAASNLFLHFTGAGCYNVYKETGMVFMPITKKQPPGEIAALQGAFFVLTRPCYVHQATCRCNSRSHLLRQTSRNWLPYSCTSPPPVARVRRAAKVFYHILSNFPSSACKFCRRACCKFCCRALQ